MLFLDNIRSQNKLLFSWMYISQAKSGNSLS